MKGKLNQMTADLNRLQVCIYSSANSSISHFVVISLTHKLLIELQKKSSIKIKVSIQKLLKQLQLLSFFKDLKIKLQKNIKISIQIVSMKIDSVILLQYKVNLLSQFEFLEKLFTFFINTQTKLGSLAKCPEQILVMQIFH